MKRLAVYLFTAMMILIGVVACQTETAQQYETRWAGENLEEIIASFENQFGGFDKTMMETGYRYNELYWAGQDGNWAYAEYQLDEMLGSLEDGFIRRPDRELSSAQFVNQAVPQLMETIQNEDREAFLQSFVRFASSCNTCHAMEEVPFVQVIIPELRTSLVKL